MLVDLGRNDVGRVAATGTVKVTENMAIESYSHVMHIVSNVEGTLKPGLDAFSGLALPFFQGRHLSVQLVLQLGHPDDDPVERPRRDVGQQAGDLDVEDVVLRPLIRPRDDRQARARPRRLPQRLAGGDLHRLVDGRRPHIQCTAEQKREAQHIVDLIGEI
jgi:hypothetical protein